MVTSGNLQGKGLLPTPTSADTFTDNLKSSQQKDTTKHSVNLSQALGHPAYVTSSPADFPASHSLTPDLERERKMTAISGQKCLESFKSFPRYGLWARTFADLLIGMRGWYSSRCRLTWKLSAMKSNRLFFQLSPSTLPIDEIGSGLLGTPRVVQAIRSERFAKGRVPTAQEAISLIPTPQAIDGSGQGRPLRMKKDMPRDPSKPGNWRGDLKDHISLLPTVRAREGNAGSPGSPGSLHNYKKNYLDGTIQESGIKTGLTLQPNFVEWMMGYPLNWTDLNCLSQNTGPKD